MEVAAVEVLSDGGVLSLVGVVEAWLSFAAGGAVWDTAWMMTVLVEVEVREDVR